MDQHDAVRSRAEVVVARLRERFVGHVPLARLARSTGMSVGTLRRVLDGDQPMTLTQFLELAAAADRAEWELLGPRRHSPMPMAADPVEDGATWTHVDFGAVAPTPALQQLHSAERLARRHDGVEWFLTVSGTITLAAGMPPQEFVLRAGEAMTIDASSPHRISSIDGTSASVVRWMSASGLRAHVVRPDQPCPPIVS